MKERVVMTQGEVVAWLNKEMPALAKYAEPDRQWIWLAVNLKGCGKSRPKNPCPCQKCMGMTAIRNKIKSIGFEFSKKGHPLPSGKLGVWLNPCDGPRPIRPFFRKRKDANKLIAPHRIIADA